MTRWTVSHPVHDALGYLGIVGVFLAMWLFGLHDGLPNTKLPSIFLAMAYVAVLCVAMNVYRKEGAVLCWRCVLAFIASLIRAQVGVALMLAGTFAGVGIVLWRVSDVVTIVLAVAAVLVGLVMAEWPVAKHYARKLRLVMAH